MISKHRLWRRMAAALATALIAALGGAASVGPAQASPVSASPEAIQALGSTPSIDYMFCEPLSSTQFRCEASVQNWTMLRWYAGGRLVSSGNDQWYVHGNCGSPPVSSVRLVAYNAHGTTSKSVSSWCAVGGGGGGW